MAAMFQAQTANWEETQEKMSQLVSRLSAFVLHSKTCLINATLFFLLSLHQINSAQRIYTNPRGTGFGGRGTGKPHVPQAHHHHQPDRPLPPSYVCYRCGQKGQLMYFLSLLLVSLILSKGHWIHDCPTNNDREFDNKPRIKRTTGIPRSFLKTVDHPNNGQLAQGVMVTPEGGYVIAQPDSYVTPYVFSSRLPTYKYIKCFMAKTSLPSERIDGCRHPRTYTNRCNSRMSYRQQALP